MLTGELGEIYMNKNRPIMGKLTFLNIQKSLETLFFQRYHSGTVMSFAMQNPQKF